MTLKFHITEISPFTRFREKNVSLRVQCRGTTHSFIGHRRQEIFFEKHLLENSWKIKDWGGPETINVGGGVCAFNRDMAFFGCIGSERVLRCSNRRVPVKLFFFLLSINTFRT